MFLWQDRELENVNVIMEQVVLWLWDCSKAG